MHKLLYTTNIRFLERTPTKEASFRDFDCKQKFYLSPWSQSILRSEYTCMRWWRSVCIICGGGGGASTTFGRHVARHTCVWFAPKRTEKKHCVVAKENMCLRPRPGCTYVLYTVVPSVRPSVRLSACPFLLFLRPERSPNAPPPATKVQYDARHKNVSIVYGFHLWALCQQNQS